jgi:hypothetical protein
MTYANVDAAVWQQKVGVEAFFGQGASFLTQGRVNAPPAGLFQQRETAEEENVADQLAGVIASMAYIGQTYRLVPHEYAPCVAPYARSEVMRAGTQVYMPELLRLPRGLDAAHGGSLARQLEQIDGRGIGIDAVLACLSLVQPAPHMTATPALGSTKDLTRRFRRIEAGATRRFRVQPDR